MALLKVRNISKKVEGNLIVNDISFDQQPLQKIAIAGESGAGKTSLLKIISGNVQPTSGAVFFEETKVIGPEEKLMPGHKKMGYLSQHYELPNHYRVEELLWFDVAMDEKQAGILFEICRINHLLGRKTNFLSGGEKQRIALCQLLVKQPELLVLDEPFSNLDPIHTDILKNVLNEITRNLKITCLLSSHDPHDTLSWADMILVIKDGKLVQQGSPQQLYYKPLNEYVAGLFGKYNLLKPSIAGLFGIDTKGSSIMTRPENFRIYKTGSGVKGVIDNVSFWGSFYEMDVAVDDIKIIVRSNNGDWRTGDKIFIALN